MRYFEGCYPFAITDISLDDIKKEREEKKKENTMFLNILLNMEKTLKYFTVFNV